MRRGSITTLCDVGERGGEEERKTEMNRETVKETEVSQSWQLRQYQNQDLQLLCFHQLFYAPKSAH